MLNDTIQLTNISFSDITNEGTYAPLLERSNPGVNNSIFRQTGTDSDLAATMKVAHEVNKSSTLCNSAIIFDQPVEDSITGEVEHVKVTFKVGQGLKGAISFDVLTDIVCGVIKTLYDGCETGSALNVEKFLSRMH